MVAGRRAFEGTSAASLIGAILEREPAPIAERQPLTPLALERLVRKCLAKSPDDRWYSAHDVADELRWISQAGTPPVVASPPLTRRRRVRTALSVAGGLLLILAGAGVTSLLTTRVSSPPGVQRLLIDTRPAEGLRGPGLNRLSRTAIALSLDGKWLVFTAVQGERQQLYRRRLAEAEAAPTEGTEGAEDPFFSPDGAWVGFWARGSLWKVRLDGGPLIEVCVTPAIAGASWSSRDVIAFGVAQETGLRTVPATGGTPTLLAKDSGGGNAYLPHFLPDGETVLFTLWEGDLDRASTHAISLRTGVQTRVLDRAVDARYVPTGHLVYMRSGRLETIGFDAAHLTVTGEAVPVVTDVMQAANARSAFVDTGAGQFTFSDTGTLVYVAGGLIPDRRSELVWADRQGRLAETVAIPPGPYSAPRLSPDGRRVLYTDTRTLRVYDIARQITTVIPVSDPDPGFQLWTPDGAQVVFGSPAGGKTRLRMVRGDGAAPSTPLAGDVPSGAAEHPGSWTPDGSVLLYVKQEGNTSSIWQFQMSRQQPSRDSGRAPVWRRDGRELFFVTEASAGPRRMMVVDVKLGGDLVVGSPRVLFELSAELYTGTTYVAAYDVSLDGQRFLFVRREATASPTALTDARGAELVRGPEGQGADGR